MENNHSKIIIKLAIFSSAAIICFAQARPVLAQLSSLATDALNALDEVAGQSTGQSTSPQTENSSSPSLIEPTLKFGIDNLNRNTINLCISGCFPNGSQQIQPSAIPNPTHLPIHFERL